MPIALRWNDMDMLGHVNNVYYFDYFQTARGLYMLAASPSWNWEENMFVIAHIACDYFRELTYKAVKPTIHVRTLGMSNKSFEFEYVITSTGKDGNPMVHARGKSVQVLVDGKQSIELPDWLRAELTSYEPSLV